MNKNHKNEVHERWGDTAAYGEYVEKTKNYSKETWDSAAQAMNDIFARFAQCKNSGTTADSEAAQALVSELQVCISENFYHCTDEILRGLGQMYTADERFKNNINKHGYGTAQFVSDAIMIGVKKPGYTEFL